MANEKTLIEELEVKDLEDGSVLRVRAEACTELGNQGRPGMQLPVATITVERASVISGGTLLPRTAGLRRVRAAA